MRKQGSKTSIGHFCLELFHGESLREALRFALESDLISIKIITVVIQAFFLLGDLSASTLADLRIRKGLRSDVYIPLRRNGMEEKRVEAIIQIY